MISEKGMISEKFEEKEKVDASLGL